LRRRALLRVPRRRLLLRLLRLLLLQPPALVQYLRGVGQCRQRVSGVRMDVAVAACGLLCDDEALRVAHSAESVGVIGPIP